MYKHFLNGEPLDLPALAVQYKDFARWQRRFVETEQYRRQLAFWERKLQGRPELSPLPLDFPYSEAKSYEGRVVDVALDQDLACRLRTVAREEGTTVFVVMLTAYKLVLASETDRLDVVIGTDVANRGAVDVESIMGFFINQIPIRTKVEIGLTVSEQMSIVRQNLVEAMSHQDVPFEQLVAHLKVDRNLNYSPLFQTKFFMETIPVGTYDFEDVDIQFINMKLQAARLDLTFGLIDSLDAIHGSIVYNTSLFNSATIERLKRKFLVALELISKDTAKPITAVIDGVIAGEALDRERLRAESMKSKLDRFKKDFRVSEEIG